VAVWLQRVKEEVGYELAVNWRYFSLEQVNSKEGPQWKVWKQPADYISRGLPAFRAAEAARRQGNEAFDRFHYALLAAKHEHKQDIADMNILAEAAGGVGLDIARFQKDLSAHGLLSRLADDHTFAVDSLGVFGTPTLVFAENQAVYLKMAAPPPPEDSLGVFAEIHHLAEKRRYILEAKRPQRP